MVMGDAVNLMANAEQLDGKTVGIIGFGNNGSSFAKKLRGFDVEVLAYDKYKAGFNSDFVSEVEMDEIFKKADVVSFHIPQNEETVYLVDDLLGISHNLSNSDYSFTSQTGEFNNRFKVVFNSKSLKSDRYFLTEKAKKEIYKN